jgi:hypothetical protein
MNRDINLKLINGMTNSTIKELFVIDGKYYEWTKDVTSKVMLKKRHAMFIDMLKKLIGLFNECINVKLTMLSGNFIDRTIEITANGMLKKILQDHKMDEILKKVLLNSNWNCEFKEMLANDIYYKLKSKLSLSEIRNLQQYSEVDEAFIKKILAEYKIKYFRFYSLMLGVVLDSSLIVNSYLHDGSNYQTLSRKNAYLNSLFNIAKEYFFPLFPSNEVTQLYLLLHEFDRNNVLIFLTKAAFDAEKYYDLAVFVRNVFPCISIKTDLNINQLDYKRKWNEKIKLADIDLIFSLFNIAMEEIKKKQ